MTAYSHYSNGTIEIINREVLNLLRALISELRWDKANWPWLIKLVEHTLNHRSQKRLAGRAPITVMTGLLANNPLDTVFFNPNPWTISPVQIDTESISAAITKLQESLHCMHKEVEAKSEEQRVLQRIFASRKRAFPNFGIGDYLLVATSDKRTVDKLSLTWHGPYRITDIHNNYIFSVENLLTIHGQVMRG